MQFEIQENLDPENWTVMGGWFTSFVALGLYLGKNSNSESPDISRILLSVPRKEYVSAAIAFGMSIHKFNTQKSILQEITESDLIKLPSNSKIRLTLDFGHKDVMFHQYRPENKSIQWSVGGPHKSHWTKLSQFKEYYLLSKSYPEGDFSFSKEEFINMDNSHERRLWRNQGSPGVAIFGDTENLVSQISNILRNELVTKLAGQSTLTLKQAARLDSLIGHSESSFVNTFASASEFSKTEINGENVLKLFDWIILDGNNAINRLCASENLIDTAVISILELGVPRSQGKALDTFNSELNRYNSIDISKLLGWKPPIGVNIWGWAK